MHVSNPCRVAPFGIFSPSLGQESSRLPSKMDIALGENYGQSEHIGKFKKTTPNRQHKILSRVVIGSDRHGKRLTDMVGHIGFDRQGKLLVVVGSNCHIWWAIAGMN